VVELTLRITGLTRGGRGGNVGIGKRRPSWAKGWPSLLRRTRLPKTAA
jgi:hypothetical protein